MLKKIAYKLLHIATLGRGIKRVFEGNIIRMPTRYFRYFPDGYEKDNFIFINNKAREGMVILDIGAHIGLMTVALAKKAGVTGKVYSFEPTPSTVKVLRETVRVNKLANVSIEPYALAEKKGKLTFYISNHTVDNSNSLVNNKRSDRKEKSIEIEVNTVDHIVAEKKLPRIDFMKIDVEGAELQVLKGASASIKKYKPPMILSIHPGAIRNFGDSQAEIWDILRDHGYNIMVEGKEKAREEFAEKQELFEVFLT